MDKRTTWTPSAIEQANSGSRLLWDVGCVQSRPVDRGKMCDACNIESIAGDGDEYLLFLHAAL